MKIFSIKHYPLILIIILSIFLHFFHIADNLHFANDEARDAFIVKNEILKGDSIRLTGPTTSLGNMKLGPFFYYYLTPFYKIFNYNPVAGGVAVAFMSLATVILIYALCIKYFSRNAGIIASLLYTTSSIVLFYSRWGWNPNILPFFTVLVLYLSMGINKASKENSVFYAIGLGITAGFAIQVHVQAMWLLVFLAFIFIWKRLKFENWFLFIVFFLTTNIALIMYEIRSNFDNSKSFFNWITSPKTSVSLVDRLSSGFTDYFSIVFSIITPYYSTMICIVLIILAMLVVIPRIKYLPNNISVEKEKNVGLFYLLLILILSFLSFFVITEMKYIHYLTLIFPILFIIIGIIFNQLFARGLLIKSLSMFFIWMLIVLNLVNYFEYDYKAQSGVVQADYDLILKDMKAVVNYIVNDSEKSEVVVKIDQNNHEDQAFRYLFDIKNTFMKESDNYQYLITRDQTAKGQKFGRLVVTKKSN